MSSSHRFPTPKIEELRKRYEEANAALVAATQRHYDERLAEFEAAGGCKTCRGRGWIVIRDTLDVSGCHESAPCPETGCTPETRRRTGLHPDNSEHDRFHDNSTWQRTEKQRAELIPLYEAVERARHDLEIEESRWSLRPGVLAEVTSQRARGRNRLPLGTIGLVRSVSESRYGTRVALRLTDGTDVWTTPTDLTVQDPDPDLESYGFETKVGFPCLVSFRGFSTSKRAIRVLSLLSNKECWLPVSQVNAVQVRRNGETLDVKLEDVRDREAVTLFVERWIAEKKGLTQP